MTSIAKNLLDKLGIAATSLCAIHCLMLPFILPLLPIFGVGFIAEESFEHSFLFGTMILGSTALYSGYKRYHNRLYPFALLFGGGLVYWQKDLFGIQAEVYIVILGATLVVLAHIINMKLCRRSDCEDC